MQLIKDGVLVPERILIQHGKLKRDWIHWIIATLI